LKKIALSFATLATTILMVTAASKAVFSDEDNFSGNQINAALVNIDARSETGNNPARLPKPIIANSLIPGQFSDWARGIIFNQADSTNVRVWMYAVNIDGYACPKVNLEVWTGHAADGADSERSYKIFDSNIFNLNGSSNRVEITNHVFTSPNWLPANTSAVIQQRAGLDSSANNDFQSKSCTWDEIFVAETPEL